MSTPITAVHQSVMLTEALEQLQPQADHWYLDATFGRGGHTRAILATGAKVIAFDVDQDAITYGQTAFAAELEAGRLILIRANFDQLAREVSQLVAEHKLTEIHGALFDFGTSVDQLIAPDRGFSFNQDSPLDMRLDQRLGVTAADLLAVLSERQLTELFIRLGGEREARAIAKAITQQRTHGQLAEIQTTQGLANLISRVKRQPSHHLNPATKVFQALRIAVNSELDVIRTGLQQVVSVLTAPARVVTIAFHEGEDRIVKQQFNEWQKAGHGEVLTKHPLTPSSSELELNNRARSAKLRAFALTK